MKYNTKKLKNKNLKKNSKKHMNYNYYGGNSVPNINANINPNASNIQQKMNDNTIQQIKQQVQNEDSIKNFLPSIQMPSVNLADSNILNKSANLVEGLGVKALEGIGDSIGIDVTDPNQVNQKLSQIKKTITDPRNVEQLKDIVSNVAEIGAVGIEAAKPFLNPLIDTTVDKFKNAASEIGEAGVKIALNTAEEIPGVGVVIGTIRSLSNAGEAGLATINAGNEVVKATSDSINAATKNFNRLIKEKGDLIDRTQNSINDFMNSSKYNPQNYLNKYNPQNYLNKYNPQLMIPQNYSLKNNYKGGKKNKKYNKKTKKNKH
jgi:hypothetical protein